MVLDLITNNAEFFIFILLMTLILFFKRKNLDLQGNFPYFYVLLYKTKLGLDKMGSWSKKYPRTYLYLAYLSIFIGIFGMIASFIFMGWQLNFIYENNLDQGAALILPIQTEDGKIGGIPNIAPPFFFWLISLFILVIVHEFAHGVIGKRFNVKIKSSGLAFFGTSIIGILIIVLNFSLEKLLALDIGFLSLMALGTIFIFVPVVPGAFVEPDLKDIKKKPWWQQIAIFGAGSTSNFIFGTLFLIMLLVIANPLVSKTTQQGDIYFVSVSNQSDLKSYDLESGKIVGINSEFDNTLILEKLKNLTVGEELILTLDINGTVSDYVINTFENPEIEDKGMVGISMQSSLEINEDNYVIGYIVVSFGQLLSWLILFNFGIGIFNLLPLGITDGGQILNVLLQKHNKKTAKLWYTLISFITLGIIILSIWPQLLFSIISFF